MYRLLVPSPTVLQVHGVHHAVAVEPVVRAHRRDTPGWDRCAGMHRERSRDRAGDLQVGDIELVVDRREVPGEERVVRPAVDRARCARVEKCHWAG